jgi:elongator complex protein 4
MSSFVRKCKSPTIEVTIDERSLQHVPSGCKIGKGGSVVASTGIASLDTLLGEGLPGGHLVVLQENEPRSSSNYANTILKCFIAQGLVVGNRTVLIGEDSEKLLGGLPGTSTRTDQQVLGVKSSVTSEKMSIAWRYKHIQAVDCSIANASESKKQFGANFDLGKKLDLGSQPIPPVVWELEGSIEKVHALLSETSKDQMVRLAVRSLGSPLTGGQLESSALIRWFYELSQLVRSSSAIVLATIPAYLHSSSVVSSIYALADCVLDIQSFRGTPKEDHPAFKDYQGFLRIVKPLRLRDSYLPIIPETASLAFKCKQRRFVIEKFHIPPDEEPEPAKPSAPTVDF